MTSKIQIVSEQTQAGVYIAQFKTNMLAIYTYYVQSDGQAYIIDPTYDYIIYRDYVAKRGATLKYVVLTHYHADFVAGHTEFNVPIVMGPNSKREISKFQVHQIPDNGKFKIGKVQTTVISTPGHTLESSCFILADENGKEFCIFTGDTVFLRQVGRPDLAVASNISCEDLAGMLFDSIQRIKALDGNLRLYPGHGGGSACGKSIGQGNFCDIKTQCVHNYAFLIQDKNEFITTLTKDLPAPPKYFFHDAKMNQQGPSVLYEEAFKKVKNPLKVEDFERFVSQNIPIIDTRHLAEGGLIKGSFWISIKAMICQLISRVLDPNTPFALIVDDGAEIEVIERLLRIGFNNILGYNGFNMSEWRGETIKPVLRTYETIASTKKTIFIDVRNKQEWEEAGVFENALLLSLPELKSKIDLVTEFVSKHPEADVIVHCKTGMRARLATSILYNHFSCQIDVLNEVLEKLPEKGAKFIPFK